MKVRSVVLAVFLVIVTLSAGLIAAPGASISSVQAASPMAPSQFTGALTYTTHLPLMLNCFPRQGPDPDFYLQYDMSIINANTVWGLCSINASGVTIAIIDTGVDLAHPDLQTNLLSGYDFWDYDTVPQDGNGHGTNVAGIAAAALNGVGVAGVAPTAKILPVRVLNNQGLGYISDIADGITYAADRAQVLNLSLGGTISSTTLLNAINYAANTKGRLVVAAAGNCGDSNYPYNGCTSQNQPIYPAAYPNVMAVAATTSSDTRASFSNVGSYVDIAAPGYNIYNTYYGNSYTYESGTSQATPHVSGLAALIWAKNPSYTAAQVWSRITSTAVDLGAAGVDTSFGAGRIDVQQALGLMQVQANAPVVNLAEASVIPAVDERSAPFAPGRIIVKFKVGGGTAAASQTLAALPDTTVEKSIAAINALVLHVPVGGEWKMIDQLRGQPEVEYAEPDYVMHMLH
jgi:thermitase